MRCAGCSFASSTVKVSRLLVSSSFFLSFAFSLLSKKLTATGTPRKLVMVRMTCKLGETYSGRSLICARIPALSAMASMGSELSKDCTSFLARMSPVCIICSKVGVPAASFRLTQASYNLLWLFSGLYSLMGLSPSNIPNAAMAAVIPPAEAPPITSITTSCIGTEWSYMGCFGPSSSLFFLARSHFCRVSNK